MRKIFLSLIIPTHNSQKTIQPLLLSINNSQFNYFKNIEVIIVDDASSDSTRRVVETLRPKLKFILSTIVVKINVGPAKARNLGVKQARGQFVLFFDSDVILKKKTLNNAYQLVLKKKLKAFTGIWDWRQNTNKFFPQFKALRDWSYWFVERKKNAHYYLFSTRVASIEKNLFQKLGGFNRDYPEPTVEDIELTYRIEKIAPIKFSPNIIVSHQFEDFSPIAIKYFKRSRDWVRLYLKRYRFDPVATSQKEAAKSIVSSLFLGFLFLTLFSRLFIYPAIAFVLLFAYLETKFWWFLLKKKGILFLLKAVPVSLLLYVIINLGAAWGLTLYLLKKSKNRQN